MPLGFDQPLGLSAVLRLAPNAVAVLALAAAGSIDAVVAAVAEGNMVESFGREIGAVAEPAGHEDYTGLTAEGNTTLGLGDVGDSHTRAERDGSCGHSGGRKVYLLVVHTQVLCMFAVVVEDSGDRIQLVDVVDGAPRVEVIAVHRRTTRGCSFAPLVRG